MENIMQEYERLVGKLYSSKDRYKEDKVVVFTPAKGTKYDAVKELMVVGRAVNGWQNVVDKSTEVDKTPILKQLRKRLENDNLWWVDDSRGAKDEYNTNKSAFWRVIRLLATEFYGEDPEVINTIVWSNLYKVAKVERGNPSTGLINVQFEHCLNILKLELDYFQPKYVVFLTGYNWAANFIDGLGVKSRGKYKDRFIEFIGTYKNSNIVVAQHPQGKPDWDHVAAILKANETFKK